MARIGEWGWRRSRACGGIVRGLCAWLCAVMLLGAGPQAAAQDASPAEPLVITIFVTTRADQCFDNGEAAAIRRLALAERDRINGAGGVAGRRLDLVFLDDRREAPEAIANMRQALPMSRAVAMIGLTATRGRTVFEEAGADIKASNIPFISAIGVNSLFAGYPNVVTMRGRRRTASPSSCASSRTTMSPAPPFSV